MTTKSQPTISGSGKYSSNFHIKANPGDNVLVDFKTFTRDGKLGYQNTGIWITDKESGYGAEPKLLYTRGGTKKVVTVGDAGTGIYVYISPYGPDEKEGSAYGGTWELTMTLQKRAAPAKPAEAAKPADIAASGKYAKDFHIKANPGDSVLIDFKTFTRDGKLGYQNTGIWATDKESRSGSDPDLLYERGATKQVVTVGDAGTGIYVKIYPYGPDDKEGSAYGGTWELTMTLQKRDGEPDMSGSSKYATDFHIKANPGDSVLLDFKTFTRNGKLGYQNTGIWVTDTESGYGAEPKLLYERGATKKVVTVGDAGNGIHVYIYPYGPDKKEGSAYGGKWELNVTLQKLKKLTESKL